LTVDYESGIALLRQQDEAMRLQCETNRMHEAWRRACLEIIDRCVAPDMYQQARAMLDEAMKAALAASQ